MRIKDEMSSALSGWRDGREIANVQPSLKAYCEVYNHF